ncbi:MAG: cell division protease FtsH [Solirubrobacteraceae bacterium]|jgi:ATP-dependent Zn protease|nr:cell division protease FtsH [Solirubrobacteraceae bacterium]
MAADVRRPSSAERDAQRVALAAEWRRLARGATFVAVLTSPATFALLHVANDWPIGWALLGTILIIAAFRGLIDVIAHRFVPRATLYGAGRELLDDDIVARRRLWYWRAKYRRLTYLALILGIPLLILYLINGTTPGDVLGSIGDFVSNPQTIAMVLILGLQIPLLFFANLLIIFGPMLFFGLKQMRGYEPGDADWGVKLEDVRGQAEPKEEVTRVISLWQSGEEFRKAGGKPERGLLFIGAPGTGKTMLSKGIATSFNSPIVTMPGSGFAQTFIGMDVIIVQFLLAKARRLARKWGGQCIVFIDEIDAVGMRRQALGAGGMSQDLPSSIHDILWFGQWGALTPTEDLIVETPEWRERLFAARAPQRPVVYPPALVGLADRINGFFFPGGMGGGMGGGLALNQLLVQMDGIDEPPFFRKFATKKFNTFLDALYIVPRKLGKASLRIRPPKPRQEQVYFIGATNVPLEQLDPALLRPGRMGRHIYFRTPTKVDRRDIFELYLGKVAHVPELDTEKRRDELARITNGYSPAMIEQVCSMALTYAHSDGRNAFEWGDIVEAITTVESGTAQNIEYAPDQSRATAIHEAGHAIASHVYVSNAEHTRLSIRKRGRSLGHYQRMLKEERVEGIAFRHEEVADLVVTLGAMAAEHVFYGENSTGVGGDVRSVTTEVGLLVGAAAIGPEPVDLSGRVPESERAEREQELMERFERIGLQIMNRLSGGPLAGDVIGAALSDKYKKRAAACILGQAYITALACMRHNREAVARIAETLMERRELYGDEVTDVLNAACLEAPEIDLLEEALWPKVA